MVSGKKTPLRGIRIDTFMVNGKAWGYAETDERGEYKIRGLAAGEYYILANCINPDLNYPTCIQPNPNATYNSYDSSKAKPPERPIAFLVYATKDNPVQVPPVHLTRKKNPTTPVDSVPRDAVTARLQLALFRLQDVPSGKPSTQTKDQTKDLSEANEVTHEPPFRQLVSTDNATRRGLVTGTQLIALPLPGLRTVEAFGLLFPGVAPPPQTLSQTPGPGLGSGIGTSGQFAVNGLRSRANNFTIDGSDNNDEDIGVRRQGFTALLPQTVESIQEYQIITLLPTAQFGRNLAGQVNLVSRTGNPTYHGTLYGFFTNQQLKARDFFDLTDGTTPVPLLFNNQPVFIRTEQQRTAPLIQPNPVGGEDQFRRWQSGFVFSGPLNPAKATTTTGTTRKTLFFTSFERLVVDAEKESHFAVPDIAARGLFGTGATGLKNPFGLNPAELYPTSVTGDAVFSFFPFSNNRYGPYGQNTFTQILPADARGTIFSARLDRAFGQAGGPGATHHQSVAGRYNFTDDDTVLPSVGGALASPLRARVRTQNLSLYHIAALAPQLTNELRASYGRTSLTFKAVPNSLFLPSRRFPDNPLLLNARLVSNSTLPSDACNAYAQLPIGLPCFNADQPIETEGMLFRGPNGLLAFGPLGPVGQVLVSGYSPVGVDVLNFPQQRVNNTFQFANTLFWQGGAWRLIVGADVRRTQLNSQLERNFRPAVVFNGAPDIAELRGVSPRSPNGFYLGSDFAAAGAPTSFVQTLALRPDSTLALRYWQSDAFATAELRVRSGFTLTLGVRYQYNTVPTEAQGRLEAFFAPQQLSRLNAIFGFERFLAGRTKIFNEDRNNLAPHVAFAWDVGNQGKTSLRGGYGIYYDQFPGAVTSQSRNFFPDFLTVNLAGVTSSTTTLDLFAANPANLLTELTDWRFVNLLARRFGNDLVAFMQSLNTLTAAQNPFQDVARAYPGSPGFVLPSATLQTPYAQHWGLTLEHEFRRNHLLAVAYVGTRGTHLLRFATPNLGFNAIPVVTNIRVKGFEQLFQGFTTSPAQQTLNGPKFERPFPLLGAFTSIESDANSSYHALQVEFSRRLNRSLQFGAAYTWSHVIDEASDLFDLASGPALPQDSFARAAERADASFDLRHNFVYSLIWAGPERGGKRLWRGWRLASVGTFRSGQPFTLLACCDVNLDGNLSDRLNTTAGIEQINQGRVRFKAPTDMAILLKQLQAPAGKHGALRRNFWRAPGTASLDLALSKTWTVKERFKFELRTEVFNVFNRTHFGAPVHQLLFPSFGQAVETRLPARTIQLAGKFSF